jgi:hypothetical protein
MNESTIWTMPGEQVQGFSGSPKYPQGQVCSPIQWWVGGLIKSEEIIIISYFLYTIVYNSLFYT